MRRRRVRRLARQVRAQRTSTGAQLRLATVEVVTANAARNSASLVQVRLGQDLIAAPYLGSAPAVGDQVTVALQDGSPLILGKPSGFLIV